MSGDIPQSSFTLVSPRFKRLSQERSWIQCHPVATGNVTRARGGKSCSWDLTCTSIPPSPLVTTAGLVTPSSAPSLPQRCPRTHAAEPRPPWGGPGPGEPHWASAPARGSRWLCKTGHMGTASPHPSLFCFPKAARAVPWQSPDAGVMGSWGELNSDPTEGWG